MTADSRVLAAAAFCALAIALPPLRAAQLQQEQPSPLAETTLHVDVTALLVPVVVRDAQGHAVGGLTQADFKVFDQGKQQSLSGFSLVRSAPRAGNPQPVEPAPTAPADAVRQLALPSPPAPPRFIVFLFDDRHFAAGDLIQVQKAATRLFDTPLAAADRALVLSFLGVNSGITRDHVPLQAAVMKLKAQTIFQHDASQCPDIDYYTASQIINKHSDAEYQIALERAANCSHKGSQTNVGYVEQLVRTAANQAVEAGDNDVRATLGYMRDVVRSMAKLPGQRTLILVSPGFLSDFDEAMTVKSQILDLAASTGITISALDARGLYAASSGAGQGQAGSIFGQINGQMQQDHRDFMRDDKDVMAELAEGSGGTFFENSNDLKDGLATLAAAPEYLYLLEIPLGKVKANGSYHPLQVKVDREGLKIQARKGYFAPRPETKRK